MTRYAIAPLLAVLVLATGCGSSDPAAEPDPATPGGAAVEVVSGNEADLKLWVSNQSFEDDPVGITLTIDGVPLIDQDFDVEGQHNWQLFPVSLDAGRHTVRVESDTGASLQRTFVVPDGQHRHAVVDYWNYDDADGRHFTWHVQKQPLVFM